MSEVRIPAPFPHQALVLDHPARFKVWRAGRRTGKSRGLLHGAVVGHGPQLAAGMRKHLGLLHGRDVAWLAPDFPQAMGIWREEIVPRFKGAAGVRVNEQEHSVSVLGLGTLWMRSHENVRSIRGLGKNLGGVIVDEGAHFDLELDWQAILVPALADNEGWAIFASTTNSGPDGNQMRRAGPSFFNLLCAEVMAGQRGDDWAHWHQDARLNPKITARSFQTMVDECAGNERRLQEEVYAALLHHGAGLAFPEFRRDVHVRAVEPDDEWSCAGGMDWGFGSPGWFGLAYTGPTGQLVVRHEWYYDHTLPSLVGERIARLCYASPVPPEFIACDSACWNVTDGSATIAEKIDEGLTRETERLNFVHKGNRHTPSLLPAAKGPEAIATQKVLIHEMLHYVEAEETDGSRVLVQPPAMLIHPDCTELARTISGIALDPKDGNKFDTTGEDHPIQGLAYLLVTRAPDYEAPEISREQRERRAKLDPLSRAEDVQWEKTVKAMQKRSRSRR